MKGGHATTKRSTSSTYSAEWSGVSYAPHCPDRCKCPDCGELLHLEGHGTHYCPICDDFKSWAKGCRHW